MVRFLRATRDVFACRILQASYFIEVTVIDLLLKGLEGAFNAGKIDDPAKVLVERSLDVNLDLETVTV